jgi:inhibitor of cysteine peptidase
MTTLRAWPAVLLTALAAYSVAGCSAKAEEPAPQGPQTTTIVVSYDELLNQKTITRSATLAVGDTLQVSLGANPSTGYRWEPQMQISDTAVLEQAGHQAVASADRVPGAPGSEVWALQAMGPGTASASTSYGRPWEGGEQESWTFTVSVTVE